MEKILVWHQGALGDLMLSLPAIYAIKNFRKGSYLHLVSRTDLSAVILENGLADEITSNERGFLADLFAESKSLPGTLRRFLAGFDRAFVFMRRIDSDYLENLRASIPEIYSIKTIPENRVKMHVSRFQMEQLKVAGILSDTKMPLLDVLRCSAPDHRGKAVIAVHPGSGGKKKCWPIDNFLTLIKLLNFHKSYYCSIILGPAEEQEMNERAIDFIAGSDIKAGIIRDASVTNVASILKMSSLYIGNDSGITHLASMIGVPTVAIFGPTDYEIWGPAGGQVRIVRSDYPCSPCQADIFKECYASKCLENLDVRKVLDSVEELLQAPDEDFVNRIQ
jgi:heptosyltransferase III